MTIDPDTIERPDDTDEIARRDFLDAEYAKEPRIRCPHCAMEYLLHDRENPACAWCGRQWDDAVCVAGEFNSPEYPEENPTCFECETATVVDVYGERLCVKCGEEMAETCPRCGQATAEFGLCRGCGGHLMDKE